MATTSDKVTRHRVPASERRDALIEAAMHEFAQTGLHGTPVDRIARSVGVAQPYVFSLFGSKRDLFLAAVDRCFERAEGMLAKSARNYDPEAPGEEDLDCLEWVGRSYVETMQSDPDLFMLQLQAFAACSDDVIRDHVRENFAGLVRWVRTLVPDAEDESVDDFFRWGMWLNVAAAMGVSSKSATEWIGGADGPGAGA
jgi:AcrR family transcriptional regulator